ncbi:hypothetical protein ACFORG_07280 [Lutimaribacter marinistellae]|uniref:Uncharacterized protein n=1 Tax=Lutimaribacter marinistellae TaxID=1820329 RepID=A0ABV7TDB6_9RHOB
MDWQKNVVRRTMEGAGEYPSVQLQFLLQRLEQYPQAVPAIADAIRDMGQWYLEHADALEAETAARQAQATLVEIAKHKK